MTVNEEPKKKNDPPKNKNNKFHIEWSITIADIALLILLVLTLFFTLDFNNRQNDFNFYSLKPYIVGEISDRGIEVKDSLIRMCYWIVNKGATPAREVKRFSAFSNGANPPLDFFKK